MKTSTVQVHPDLQTSNDHFFLAEEPAWKLFREELAAFLRT
jgi:hypothetical protein